MGGSKELKSVVGLLPPGKAAVSLLPRKQKAVFFM